MQRLQIFLLVALWSLPAAAVAQEPQNLPDDSQRYLLILVASDQDTTTEARLNALFREPQLNRFARGCNIHEWRASNEVYRQLFSAALPPTDLPVLALARPDGGVIYKASGARFPSDPKELLADLTYYLKLDQSLRSGSGQSWDAVRTQDCPDGSCPNVNPDASPSRPWLRPLQPDGPALHPGTWIPDSVDLRPQVSVDFGGQSLLWILVGILALGAIGLGGFLFVLATQS